MDAVEFILKLLFLFAAVLVMTAPLILALFTFARDREKKISCMRFRIVIYTAIYTVFITIALFVLKALVLKVESLPFVQWLANKLAVSSRVVYCGEVVLAMLVNFAVGFLHRILGKFVRIGLKKEKLTEPKNEDGTFTAAQQRERKVIAFFNNEKWFLVAHILKCFAIALTLIYSLLFILYQIPALFGADWVPYDFISMLFRAGYVYPMISLLVLWEAYFFLDGIRHVEEECPELVNGETADIGTIETDLKQIDEAIRKEFKKYYVCDVDLSKTLQTETAKTKHHEITEWIEKAIENDARNPQGKSKEIYLNCLDKMVGSDKSLLINGAFFSEFSAYFLRYLSVIAARGDNIAFVCSNDSQIEEVYRYIKEGLSQISSLYCKNDDQNVDYDDPIWRIVRVKSDDSDSEVDDNSILVTSLSYLCSSKFESDHSRFVHLLDTVVFVDTLRTANTYSRQLAMLNTRLKHISKINALLAKDPKRNNDFRVRYMSKQVRYLCFDDTRTPGLDKVLKNRLAVDFESADAMYYNPDTIVRCYTYEGQLGEDGRRNLPDVLGLGESEEIGTLMTVALMCLAKGASSVNIFADELIPYENIRETVEANMGRAIIKVDGNNICLNTAHYNANRYNVLIVMDSSNNLPATLRRYISMVSDKPALVLVFSRPYMMRDYYTARIDDIWSNAQIEQIPVESGTKKDIAQKILVKANAGGISEKELLKLAEGIPEFAELVKKKEINEILRAVLALNGVLQADRNNLYRYFEYSSSQDFNENGEYDPEDKILLRRQGKLFDMIDGREMVIMVTEDGCEIALPLPRNRLTQNYISDQNLLYNGKIYHIDRIDTEAGRIYAKLTESGKNTETYQYIQAREYRVELAQEAAEAAYPIKHVLVKRTEEDVSVNEIYVCAFRAPMEVLTDGYFKIDSHTLASNAADDAYRCLDDGAEAIQTYRRYGAFSSPTVSAESVGATRQATNENGALMMSIRICGEFGEDVDKTMSLAAAMLNELLHSMFPSVADSVAVCPVLHAEMTDENADILKKHPKLTVIGESSYVSKTDFDLLIIEDCTSDLGVVSVLMSAGDNVLQTLFDPVFRYLTWYADAEKKSDYLYYGLGSEPSCFNFETLRKLSKLLADDKHDLTFVDMETVTEYLTCDFCGKRHPKSFEWKDMGNGRKMCAECVKSVRVYNTKALNKELADAKMFLEETYKIKIGDDYKLCCETMEKISNELKKHSNLAKQNAHTPYMSYVKDKHIYAEKDIPPINLSELVIRELTRVWQMSNLINVSEELMEGQIALVSVQYLNRMNSPLASVRLRYYESSDNLSGEGYRKIVRGLQENPKYKNNPFAYLLGKPVERENFVHGDSRDFDGIDLGEPYTPSESDRVLNADPNYFYYERMMKTWQSAYDILRTAIENHQEVVPYTDLPVADVDSLKKIFEAIAYDHPELFWYSTWGTAADGVHIVYGASAEEAELLQKRIDEVIPRYMNGIVDSMSAYDVALRLYTRVIMSVDYDSIALEKQKREKERAVDEIDYLRTICGVFLNGKAVCEGYARALQYLLQKCGIECAEVAGFVHKEDGRRGGAHAWNIVKIDGDYYYLDVTWDDRSNTVQTVKNDDFDFHYFCITTEELLRSRDVSLCPTEVPMCTAVKANYYYHNGCVLDTYDLEKIKEIAKTTVSRYTKSAEKKKPGKKVKSEDKVEPEEKAKTERKAKSFTIKCASRAVYDECRTRLFEGEKRAWGDVLKAAEKADNRIQADSVTWAHEDRMLGLTIFFRYKQ